MIKMVIWDQSKPISLYLKIKNTKFVNFTFIIHKNGNKTSIQPILKLNSTSFMFNNIVCEMNIKKVNHWGVGVAWGNGGTVPIPSWKCISVFGYPSNNLTFMLAAFYWFFMCWFLLLIHFSILLVVSPRRGMATRYSE